MAHSVPLAQAEKVGPATRDVHVNSKTKQMTSSKYHFKRNDATIAMAGAIPSWIP
jgi:hypothetical protein